jgi:hypothetical protein
MAEQFETDSNGSLVTRPVTGWTTAPVAEMFLLLAIRYVDTPEEIETGGKLIQFVLTHKQCLQLARTLTGQARRLLTNAPDGKPLN